MIKSELTIIDPKPPLFNRIMISLVFTGFSAIIMYLVKRINLVEEINVVAVIICMVWLLGAILLMTFGSVSRHGMQFSFEELKIRHIYDIGFYRYKEAWQDLHDLKYLSIYKEDESYNVIVWYEERNFLNLFSLKSYENIVDKACLLSDGLKIDLLDATIDDDYNHWIDKAIYRSTGKISHYSD